MAGYIFTNKIGRGHKVINRAINLKEVDLTDDFIEMYDQMTANWKRQARDLIDRRLAARNLKYL